MVARPCSKADSKRFVRRISGSWDDRGLKIGRGIDFARVGYW